MAAKIKKGDRVVVIAGKSKGAQGEVLKVITETNRVVVQGAAMIKRHVKPSQTNPQGGIDSREAAIAVSNVAHIDPTDGKPTRVGFKTLEDGRKVRYAKRSGEVLDR